MSSNSRELPDFGYDQTCIALVLAAALKMPKVRLLGQYNLEFQFHLSEIHFVDKLSDSFYLFSPKILNLCYTKEHKISHPSLIALELYVIEVCLFLHAGLPEFSVILSPKQFKQHVLCYEDQEWTPLSDSSLQVKEISRKTTSQRQNLMNCF